VPLQQNLVIPSPSALAISAKTMVDRLAAASMVLRVDAGYGAVQFRQWSGPQKAPTLLLVHGGSGSWMHWVKNINTLRKRYNLWAIDLPGLGASDTLPGDYTAEDAIDAFVKAVKANEELVEYHIAAFSWGCAVASQGALSLDSAVKSITLVGPASIGNVSRVGGMKPLERFRPNMNAEAIAALHRNNLAHLMISDRRKIDALAMFVQIENTRRARFNSPKFARNTMVLEAIAKLQVPIQVLYGDQDGPALPDVAGKQKLFFNANPRAEFKMVADSGHWMAFEQPKVFEALLQNWIDQAEAL
jgi:pimeloyl-ACP methyl ester carboxylesterase